MNTFIFLMAFNAFWNRTLHIFLRIQTDACTHAFLNDCWAPREISDWKEHMGISLGFSHRNKTLSCENAKWLISTDPIASSCCDAIYGKVFHFIVPLNLLWASIEALHIKPLQDLCAWTFAYVFLLLAKLDIFDKYPMYIQNIFSEDAQQQDLAIHFEL